MAIIPYRERNVSPEYADRLSDINAHSLQTKAMLTALGDYWTNYYRNLEPIAAATSGSVASISKEYTKLLDLVKSANVLDVPLLQTTQFELLVIKLKDLKRVEARDGSTDYYFVPLEDVVDTRYLTTSLFESRVVLEKGIHFDVVKNEGFKFYVDLFEDKGITGYTFEVGEDQERGMLLWACDIAFTSTVIYDRYGRFLYKKAADSEQYKWLVSGLMRFYESAKSVYAIQEVLNVMYGIPYSRYKDEVVKEIYYVDKNLNRILSQIEDPYICIETDRACYYTYAFSEVRFKVGETIPRFSLLADFNKVEDYITKPGWWEDTGFPSNLVAGGEALSVEMQNELMDKVLKYNTVHIKLGVSFETYATYCAQVKEFFRIIEGGFPVYLYPFVDTFFRAVFLDDVDMKDVLDRLRLTMLTESKYPWNDGLRFDGTVCYYSEPDRDYGSESECIERLYDGKEAYDGTARGSCKPVNCLHHGEEDGTYSSTHKVLSGKDIEYLNITKVGYRTEEKYPWETSPNIPDNEITYSGIVNADGTYNIGDSLGNEENENFTIHAKTEFVDNVPEAEDGEFNIVGKVRPFESEYANAIFDGSHAYDGLKNPFVFKEDISVNKMGFRENENYPWETSKGMRLVPVTYSSCFLADGSHTFSEEMEELESDPFIISIRLAWQERAEIKDDFDFSLNPKPFEDKFRCVQFDGTLHYTGFYPQDASINEKFEMRVVNQS